MTTPALTLSFAELDKAFDTEKYKADRDAEYPLVVQGPNPWKFYWEDVNMFDGFCFTDYEVGEYLSSGQSLWTALSYIVEEFDAKYAASKDKEKLLRGVIHTLGLMPEGPFFYAVRALSITPDKCSSEAADNFTRALMPTASTNFFSDNVDTRGVRIAAERMNALAHKLEPVEAEKMDVFQKLNLCMYVFECKNTSIYDRAPGSSDGPACSM